MSATSSKQYKLSPREILLLSILAITVTISCMVAFNWRKYRFQLPMFQALAQKEMLLDMNNALIRYKMNGTGIYLLSAKTPKPILFELLHRYIDAQSHLIEMGPNEYHELISNLQSEGEGIEYTFTQYKSARYP